MKQNDDLEQIYSKIIGEGLIKLQGELEKIELETGTLDPLAVNIKSTTMILETTKSLLHAYHNELTIYLTLKGL